MRIALLVIHTLIALGLMVTVLLQSGKSAGLTGAITGGSESIFGKKKGLDEVLAKYSLILGLLFILTSLTLAVLH